MDTDCYPPPNGMIHVSMLYIVHVNDQRWSHFDNQNCEVDLSASRHVDFRSMTDNLKGKNIQKSSFPEPRPSDANCKAWKYLEIVFRSSRDFTRCCNGWFCYWPTTRFSWAKNPYFNKATKYVHQLLLYRVVKCMSLYGVLPSLDKHACSRSSCDTFEHALYYTLERLKVMKSWQSKLV